MAITADQAEISNHSTAKRECRPLHHKTFRDIEGTALNQHRFGQDRKVVFREANQLGVMCHGCNPVSDAPGDTRDKLTICGCVDIKATGNVDIGKRITHELRNPRKASTTIRTFTDYTNVPSIGDLMGNTQVRRPVNLRPSV